MGVTSHWWDRKVTGFHLEEYEYFKNESRKAYDCFRKIKIGAAIVVMMCQTPSFLQKKNELRRLSTEKRTAIMEIYSNSSLSKGIKVAAYNRPIKIAYIVPYDEINYRIISS